MSEEVCPCCGRPFKATKSKPTDEEWMASLKDLYPWVDLVTEMKRIDAWLSINPRRQKTKRFIINWLNKVEKPLQLKIERPKIKKALPEVDDLDYREWKAREGYPPVILNTYFYEDPAYIQKAYLKQL
jgi:hypothetical protein